MTHEEMEKIIEFSIKQQAQADTRLTRVEESLAELVQAVNKTNAGVDALAELHAQADTRTSRLEDSFQLLVELARRTNDRLDHHDERLDRLDGGAF